MPLREVNFKVEGRDLDGPVVVPDDRNIPEKPDGKPEKKRGFLFFRKKKKVWCDGFVDSCLWFQICIVLSTTNLLYRYNSISKNMSEIYIFFLMILTIVD